MWYEILPSFGIMVGCITATGLGLKAIDRLFLGGKPKRYHVDEFDSRMMKRDKALTGSEYVQKGL